MKKKEKQIISAELINFIIEAINKYFSNKAAKVILFGSRAVRANSKTSDYDLAFEILESENLNELFIFIKEYAPTLCDMDLIDLNNCQDDLKNKILSHGVVIYGK